MADGSMNLEEAKTGVKIRVRDAFNATISDPPVINGLVMYRVESRFGEPEVGHGSEKPERCEILKDQAR